MSRARVLAGLLAPVAFVTGWAVLGARTAGYSPVDDPISRLAAVDAPTRVPMTAALGAYGLGLALFSPELRRHLGGPVATAAVVNVVGTLGIAATPLDSSVGGAPHAVAAGVSYVSLGAMPLLAARSLGGRGRTAAACASAVLGAGALASLAMSAFGPDRTGLWQRTGLTLGDVWIVATAASLLGRAEASGDGT